jgi:hypothetical protein
MEYTEQVLNSIDEALADEAFVEKLAKAESKEQFRTLFLNEKGIELEDEDVQEAFDKLEYVRNGGELSAEDLEDASGGRRGWSLGSFVRGLPPGVHITHCPPRPVWIIRGIFHRRR